MGINPEPDRISTERPAPEARPDPALLQDSTLTPGERLIIAKERIQTELTELADRNAHCTLTLPETRRLKELSFYLKGLEQNGPEFLEFLDSRRDFHATDSRVDKYRFLSHAADLGFPEAEEFISFILRDKNQDIDIRHCAARELGKFAGPDAAQTLLDYGLNLERESGRSITAKALCGKNFPFVVEGLTEHFEREEDLGVKTAILSALGSLESRDAQKFCAGALNHESGVIRTAALEALTSCTEPDILHGLIHKAVSEESTESPYNRTLRQILSNPKAREAVEGIELPNRLKSKLRQLYRTIDKQFAG